MKNIAHSAFTPAQMQTASEALATLENLLNDGLAALTREERLKYGSINEQNKLLVNKIRDYNQNQPELSAPQVNWTEFELDYQARLFYGNLAQRVESLAYRLQSTKIMHDYDNYQDALTDYSYAQYGKGAGLPGFAEKVEEIKQFFGKKSGGSGAPPPDNP